MDPRHARSTLSPWMRCGLIAAFALAPLAAAQAYVGPGAGLSLLGALWGVIAAIGAALLFVVTWPLRRMRRQKREAARAREESPQQSKAAEADRSAKPADEQPPRS